MMSHRLAFGVLLFTVIACPATLAQKRKARQQKPSSSEQKQLANSVEQARADYVKATKEYKSSLEQLLALSERNIKPLKEREQKLGELFSQGLVSRHDVEESHAQVLSAQAKVDDINKQIKLADVQVAQTLEESRIAEQIAKAPRIAPGALLRTSAYFRYNGPRGWLLSEAGSVQSFFYSTFHRSLPVSAFGQTALHDRMGLDHHNAMDVALNPDGPEGQALLNYLRTAGIPYIAFRSAVPGSATGPHIHIGKPSHRTS